MKSLMIVLLCLAALLLPTSALACCIYNKAKTPIFVNFGCGFACHNNWTIYPRDHKCRPGKGGEATVRVMNAANNNEIDNGACTVKVDKHGWVSVQQSGKHVKVISKHKDGSVREERHMKILGD